MDKTTSKLLQIRKEKINELKEEGVHLYPNDFKPTCTIKSVLGQIAENPDNFGEDKDSYRIAGGSPKGRFRARPVVFELTMADSKRIASAPGRSRQRAVCPAAAPA